MMANSWCQKSGTCRKFNEKQPPSDNRIIELHNIAVLKMFTKSTSCPLLSSPLHPIVIKSMMLCLYFHIWIWSNLRVWKWRMNFSHHTLLSPVKTHRKRAYFPLLHSEVATSTPHRPAVVILKAVRATATQSLSRAHSWVIKKILAVGRFSGATTSSRQSSWTANVHKHYNVIYKQGQK